MVDPVIVVEVVSPRSERRDSNAKLIGYFTVASIHHDLIAHADRRIVVHHARDGDHLATRILGSGDVRLDPPGMMVRVEDLFETVLQPTP